MTQPARSERVTQNYVVRQLITPAPAGEPGHQAREHGWMQELLTEETRLE
jgi:hypothetical protein